jgi:hypothetical protein
MSLASTNRTIKFSAKTGTYTASIMSPTGDIYQEWEGTQNDYTVSPNFEETKPQLLFTCLSSRVSEGIVTPDGITFYFNGNKIDFDGNDSKDPYKGYFKKIVPSENQPYYGLQIVKNIAGLSLLANATIKMVANVSFNEQTDVINAEYIIPIQKATGTSYHVTIGAGDNKAFVIRDKGGYCVLKAYAYQGSTQLTKNLTYKWERMNATGWEEITGQAAQTLTVYGDDVDTFGEYRVTVYRDNVEIGKDIQGVMDASDPYDLEANPKPEDETIYEDDVNESDSHNHIIYTPKIVKRGSDTAAIPNAQFYFVVKDSAGVILNTNSNTATSTSFTVTHAMAMQAGGDFSITITSKD